MSGWVLRDEASPVRTLTGTLTDVHNSGGNILLGEDSDTNMAVVPDAAGQDLLTNRSGVDNADGIVECEVNVTEDGDGRSRYERWVSSMIGHEITAIGVYVDDTGHDDKTEIHPMDLIVTRIDVSALPQDWIGDVARQHGLQVGAGLLAYRYAAASDDRGGVFFESPPLAKQTRSTSITLPFPARQAGAISPQVEVRGGGARNAASHIDVEVVGDVASADLVVTVKAVDSGGPGFDLGEVALYWAGSRQLKVSPSALTFGTIDVGNVVVRRFAVSNTGSEPVTLTIPGSPFPGAFGWNDVPATTLPAGGSFEVVVDYSPATAGHHTGAVSVASDAEGNPHVVTLDGRAKAVIPH